MNPGDPVPDLVLPTDQGPVPLASLRGQRVLLFFFPKADTPGCTIEARGFRDAWPAIQAKGVRVYGVSKDPPKKQGKWKEKECLPYPLVADDGALCEAFGVWREKKQYGRAYMGIARVTVLLGADGRVEKVWDPVKAAGHAEQVLAAL